MNIVATVCVMDRIICRCSYAGKRTTVSTMKNRKVLVHLLNEGNRKSSTNAMKVDMITIMKLDRTVPSTDSIIGIMDSSSDHLIINLESVSSSVANCGSQRDSIAILIATCAIVAIDSYPASATCFEISSEK